jgi:hypothetical protein
LSRGGEGAQARRAGIHLQSRTPGVAAAPEQVKRLVEQASQHRRRSSSPGGTPPGGATRGGRRRGRARCGPAPSCSGDRQRARLTLRRFRMDHGAAVMLLASACDREPRLQPFLFTI